MAIGGERGGQRGVGEYGLSWSDCLHDKVLLFFLLSGTLRNDVEATIPGSWYRRETRSLENRILGIFVKT